MSPTYELRVTETQWRRLYDHLFPGDDDEHGAAILAGVAHTTNGVRLIARDVILAQDGVDYVPGRRGYRMLTADFVQEVSDRAAEEGLAYIAVHCHGGTTGVGLSSADRASQERGYPALLDILGGQPVVGAVFAVASAAGDVWLPDRSRHPLDRVVVSGTTRLLITPNLRDVDTCEGDYTRQALLFGDRGQELLRRATVVVVGCGGIGSILVELLARLGVGHLIVIDDDVVEPTNLPRWVGARRLDAMEWLTRDGRPAWVRRIGRRFARPKVNVAARIAKRANKRCEVTRINGDVSHEDVARTLTGADYIFLAADSFRARLVVNAVAFQYGIPAVQLGAKVAVRKADGAITDVFSVVRPFGPETGCLWCNNLIPPTRLAEEAVGVEQAGRQRYVDDPDVAAPSVVTINSVAASHAVNEFMFHITGLPRAHAGTNYFRALPITGEVEYTTPRQGPECSECGDIRASRRGRADGRTLPTTDR
ncbi:MAG: ThiF family adenylyltransferase [Acidimicrobiales bacterium]|nr:ThiF family adenylyltransferase [Acidimicrobiales bacterium]